MLDSSSTSAETSDAERAARESCMDYEIAGVQVDCKFSKYHGGWMIPREAIRGGSADV